MWQKVIFLSSSSSSSFQPEALKTLEEVSLSEGYGMVKRLCEDFLSGKNRFDLPGETLFQFIDSNHQILGVGGVNRETAPHLPTSGRIRRVYLHPNLRGQGIGKELIQKILEHSKSHFTQLCCNVGPKESYTFYEKLGFQPVDQKGITHLYLFPQEKINRKTLQKGL